MSGTAPSSTDHICVCAALRRAARSATQLYDLVLQPSGLRATQFIALRTIAHAGELPQWQFARQQALAVETLSRRLAVLRRRGFVTVRTGRNHGERIYSLTSEGKVALARATPYWERAQERLRRTLGDAALQSLLDVCENAVSAAQQAEQLRANNALVQASRPKDSEADRAISRSVVPESVVPRSGETAGPGKSTLRIA